MVRRRPACTTLRPTPSPFGGSSSPSSPLEGYSPLSTLHSPLPTLHSPLSTLHSPLSTLHSPLSTLHSPLSTLHSPLSSPLEVFFPLSSPLEGYSPLSSPLEGYFPLSSPLEGGRGVFGSQRIGAVGPVFLEDGYLWIAGVSPAQPVPRVSDTFFSHLTR